MDLEAARAAMIDSQVRPSDVTDRRVIAAMSGVKRETFVPEARRVIAYADTAIETGEGRWLMASRDYSKMLQIAGIKDTDRVLDVAPGLGYSTAVLAQLAGSVVALEEPDRTAALKAALLSGGVDGVEIVAGPLKAGAAAKGPFDVILVNGTVEDVPQAWLDQLAEEGRLVVPVAENGVRRVRIYLRSGGKSSWRTPFESSAPVLPGFELAQEFRL